MGGNSVQQPPSIEFHFNLLGVLEELQIEFFFAVELFTRHEERCRVLSRHSISC